MKAINLIAILSLLLLVIACVPTAEELAGVNKTNKTEEIAEPVVEVKQEITVVTSVPENKTEIPDAVIDEKQENTTNKTNAITGVATPPQIAGKTIVYTGGAVEMGEGEKANIIIQ
ncbi:hypothetical protein KY333_00125 [Candidatus Woesearchaeota archaeon]|nr:hypothetical protein [Candidatus Woesearchaeota archaeon]MBW2994681.1 hypothetical protein [Candidatus Woesearchaeota archaeon]